MGNKKGQILLITVMLLATVMTVVLSISFKSITETQVTKLEEESQKALAAAESAIDVALKTNASSTLGPGGSAELTSITGFSGGATIDTTTSNTFISPNILKDNSYTFYLGDYDVDNKTIGASNNQYDITLCFQSGAVNPAIEITLIKTTGVRKYVVDDPSSSRITNAYNAFSSCTPNNSYNFSYPILKEDIGVDGKFLLVRVLYAPTKLLFHRDVDLPVQGRTISSQATSSTSTGVSKKVVLFQSHPQIPPEFFTTAF